MNIWDLITNKEYQAACELADEEYKNGKRISSLRSKVTALMLMRRYEDIIETENVIISQTKGSIDSDFIFYGLALWALGKPIEAIAKWKEGEKCTYTDVAGGLELLVILYFALIKIQDKKESERYFKKIQKIVSKSKALTSWPYPIGSFLLGYIQFEQLVTLTSNDPMLKQRQLSQAYFVKSIKKLEESNFIDYSKIVNFSVEEFQLYGIVEQMYFIMKVESEL